MHAKLHILLRPKYIRAPPACFSDQFDVSFYRLQPAPPLCAGEAEREQRAGRSVLLVYASKKEEVRKKTKKTKVAGADSEKSEEWRWQESKRQSVNDRRCERGTKWDKGGSAGRAGAEVEEMRGRKDVYHQQHTFKESGPSPDDLSLRTDLSQRAHSQARWVLTYISHEILAWMWAWGMCFC